jgi:hypothetical protein
VQHLSSSHSVGGSPVRTGRPTTVCDDTRCCTIQFDLLMMSTTVIEHVEEYYKLIIKKTIFVLSWSITRIILRMFPVVLPHLGQFLQAT